MDGDTFKQVVTELNKYGFLFYNEDEIVTAETIIQFLSAYNEINAICSVVFSESNMNISVKWCKYDFMREYILALLQKLEEQILNENNSKEK